MRYTVVLEAMQEPEHEGWYYAHIPTLDLTTHGVGVDGALSAAADLIQGWIAERRANGEPVPTEARTLVAQVEVDDALHAA
jgi:predicted RNase H-like HicB family nuclease